MGGKVVDQNVGVQKVPLPQRGCQQTSRTFFDPEFRVQSDARKRFCISFPAEHSGGGPYAAEGCIDRDLHFFVLCQRQRPLGLEHAVFVRGFDDDGHGGTSLREKGLGPQYYTTGDLEPEPQAGDEAVRVRPLDIEVLVTGVNFDISHDDADGRAETEQGRKTERTGVDR